MRTVYLWNYHVAQKGLRKIFQYQTLRTKLEMVTFNKVMNIPTSVKSPKNTTLTESHILHHAIVSKCLAKLK